MQWQAQLILRCTPHLLEILVGQDNNGALWVGEVVNREWLLILQILLRS